MPRIRCANAPATASLFVQLSLRRQNGWGGFPMLDLLLPRSFHAAQARAIRPYHLGSAKRAAGAPRQPLKLAAPSITPSWRISASHCTKTQLRTMPPVSPCRTFSTSPACRATYAIFNPQVDDDGNEMTLEITPRAAKRLSEIMSKDSNLNLALRIQVESGGCHGFQYLMKLVTLPSSLPSKESLSSAAEADDSAAIHEDDTNFYLCARRYPLARGPDGTQNNTRPSLAATPERQ
ncbi:hypothetical protein VTH06DRAFT_1155 [Thermothelomyces fergusii]